MKTSSNIYGVNGGNRHGRLEDAISAGIITKEEARQYNKSTKAIMMGYRSKAEFSEDVQYKLDRFFRGDQLDYADFKRKCYKHSGDNFVTVCCFDAFRKGKRCYYDENGNQVDI